MNNTSDPMPTSSTATEQVHAPYEAGPNIPLALVAGLAASVVGAAIWALVTVVTKFQIGWMAVGVGFLVGCSIGYFNRGRSSALGYAGAILSLFGCLLGNSLSLIGFLSIHQQVSFFEVLTQVDYTKLPGAIVDTFQVMDLLFYGIAVYEGFKFSIGFCSKKP